MAAKKSKAGASKSEPETEAEAFNFETSIARLGEIVETLEAGELPLENSLKLFEEGVSLARKSQGVLDNAERRVEELLKVDDSGNPVTREIETE